MRVNETEALAWKADRGQDWVRLQAVLDRLMVEVAELLLERAGPQPGDSVIDIGCGAGATALLAARRVGPQGRVLGADISDPLLDLARARAAAEGLTNLSFEIADAQIHPFAAASADLLISRFGVMFFDDSAAAFRNMAAALRPGGRMVLAAWAGPEHNPWFAIPTRAAIAQLGPVEQPPPTAPGPLAFRDIDRVTGLMAAGGLEACAGHFAQVMLHPPADLERCTQFALELGPVSRLLNAAKGTDADRAAIEATIRDEISRFVTPEGIEIPAGINLFTARRPD